jgi:spore coat protein A
VRVNRNEVVDIVVRFQVFAGRYMYHCHILEHEDHDMMRPFVVTPAAVMEFMDMRRKT